MKKYDVIAIGTGSNNIVLDAALKQGLKCAQIERSHFGGTCLTRGCIPTKVMATTADYIREIMEVTKIGVETSSVHINWDIVSNRVWQKINESQAVLAYYQAKPNLDIYQGTGYFTGPKNIQIKLNDGTISEEITSDKIFIAVGARSFIPQIDGLTEAGYICSESLFGNKYPKKPYKSLIILGGGPIGTEFAHIFAAAGTNITILQRADRLLPKEDAEISAQLLKNFQILGINVRLSALTTSVRTAQGDKIVTFTDHSGNISEVRAEEIMVASGILANTDTLQLENTAIKTDSRGWIETNEFL
ncbi:MAG: FAD-dependent oxidoreductase, partial [Pelosinus sp.]|nr:FAD-dependent oxidoreductase [Pelosinus sp.]